MIQYEFPNGKYANKENESNDKRNDVTKPSCSGGESKFDWAEKQAIHQQRKLRLIQVTKNRNEILTFALLIINMNKSTKKKIIIQFFFFFNLLGATAIERDRITNTGKCSS